MLWEGSEIRVGHVIGGACSVGGAVIGGAVLWEGPLVSSSHRCLRSIKSIKLIHENELNNLLISVSSFSYVCFF